MSASPELDAAAARVRDARRRLGDTTHDLQARLDKKVLLDSAVNGARDRALDLADATADAAAARPGVAAAVLGGVVLLLLRRPLARILRRKPKPKRRDDD